MALFGGRRLYPGSSLPPNPTAGQSVSSTRETDKIEKTENRKFNEAVVVKPSSDPDKIKSNNFLESLERVVELALICGAKFIPYVNSPPSG